MAGERATWGASVEFILSLLGYAVGMSNVLRFPYVCMRNGGGAFLVPYFTCITVCGMTMVFLEMILGQNVRVGCISCWNHYAPVFKGVGYGMALVSAACVLYGQAYYSWILYYIYQSFTWDLPWTSCNNTWNTDACISSLYTNYSGGNYMTVNSSHINESVLVLNDTDTTGFEPIPNDNSSFKLVSSAEEFFQHKVLEISDGIDNFGTLRPHLVITHVIGWIAIYACVCKGVKSVGKVVYVSATAPYIFIIIFLVRAALLPGSLTGVLYFITPNLQRLTNPNTWLQAFIQVFYSFGMGWGGIITMASYNKYKHPLHREAILVPLISSMTSVLCGFLVFSVAGFLAHKSGTTVGEAISSGPGLAFVTYPEAAAHLPGAPIWAVLFFVMLILTGADSQFVTFETSVTALIDELRINKKYNIYVVTAVSMISMLLGLVFTCNAGMYIFQVIDWYIAIACVFLFATTECIGTMWLYGYKRLFNDIEAMIGFKPNKYIFVPLWGVLLPMILMVSMVWSMVGLSPPTYGSYVYPSWAPIFGWIFGVSFTLPVGIVAIYKFCNTNANSFTSKIYLTVFPHRDTHLETKRKRQNLFCDESKYGLDSTMALKTRCVNQTSRSEERKPKEKDFLYIY